MNLNLMQIVELLASCLSMKDRQSTCPLTGNAAVGVDPCVLGGHLRPRPRFHTGAGSATCCPDPAVASRRYVAKVSETDQRIAEALTELVVIGD